MHAKRRLKGSPRDCARTFLFCCPPPSSSAFPLVMNISTRFAESAPASIEVRLAPHWTTVPHARLPHALCRGLLQARGRANWRCILCSRVPEREDVVAWSSPACSVVRLCCDCELSSAGAAADSPAQHWADEELQWRLTRCHSSNAHSIRSVCAVLSASDALRTALPLLLPHFTRCSDHRLVVEC